MTPSFSQATNAETLYPARKPQLQELTAFCVPIDQKLRLSLTSLSPQSHLLSNPRRMTSTRTILKATTPMAHTLPLLFLSPTTIRNTRMVGNKKIKIPRKHTTLHSARALQNLPKCSNHHPLALRQTTLMSTILIGGATEYGGERYLTQRLQWSCWRSLRKRA